MSARPFPLETGYTAEIDNVSREAWYQIIDQFSDANIFQTWDYEAVRFGEKNISRLVLRLNDEIIAIAQARILRIPIIKLGIAYVFWGPLWRLRNKPQNLTTFRFAIRALRNEYVCNRGLILRIFPFLYDHDAKSVISVIHREGYKPNRRIDRGHTIIFNIAPSIDQLRKNLTQRWRRCLNKAEKNQMEILEGSDDSIFEEFIDIYRSLLKRKKFPEPNDINEFRLIQERLPPNYKMKIILCKTDGHSSAGGIFTAIGDSGIYLFGATNENGMKNNSAYLVHWRALQWIKGKGCQSYDLYGINPETNPGTYVFKSGLAGKTGRDIYYLGRFDSYSGLITESLACLGDRLFPLIRNSLFRLRS